MVGSPKQNRPPILIFATSIWVPQAGCTFLSVSLDIVIWTKNNWSWDAAFLRLILYFLSWLRPHPLRSVEACVWKKRSSSKCLFAGSMCPYIVSCLFARYLVSNCSWCVEEQFQCQKEIWQSSHWFHMEISKIETTREKGKCLFASPRRESYHGQINNERRMAWLFPDSLPGPDSVLQMMGMGDFKSIKTVHFLNETHWQNVWIGISILSDLNRATWDLPELIYILYFKINHTKRNSLSGNP